MKIKTLQEDLKNAVILTSHFISPRAQIPILGNILLKAEKSKLILAATNLETSVSTAIGVKVEKEGEITVPGRTLMDIITNLSPGGVEIEVDKEQIKITSGSFKSTLAGINTSDYPKVPEKFLGKKVISISKDLLINSLSKCHFAVSNDDTRPVLTGILFLFKKDSLFLVATDGFRLSQKRIPLSDKTKPGIDIERLIIPKGVLLELSKNIGGENINFTFSKSDNQIVFGEGDIIFSSRVIEGEYPDFEKIVPKSYSIRVTVDKEELTQAIKLASVFAREEGNIINLKITKENVSIIAKSSASGSQETKVEAKVETEQNLTKGFEISYNFRFIEEFLHAVEADEVVMEFVDANAPGKFLDSKDPNFLHLIMPIRI